MTNILLLHSYGLVCPGLADGWSRCALNGILEPLGAVPQALTLLGGGRFISWRLRRLSLDECQRGPRHIWSRRACLSYGYAPRPTLKRPFAILSRLVGRVTNRASIFSFYTDLVGCVLAWLTVSWGALWLSSSSLNEYPPWRGWVHRLVPEAPHFREMPTGSEAFLEIQGASGLRSSARTHLKRPCATLVRFLDVLHIPAVLFCWIKLHTFIVVLSSVLFYNIRFN